MAFDVGSVTAKVTADISDFEKGMNKAKADAGDFTNGLSKMGDAISTVAKQSAIFAGVVGGVALVAAKQSVDAYEESQTMLAQLDAVLKSTGGQAGMTRDQIIALSRSLQANTTISDESALATENMLLTFTSVGKSVFPSATKAIVDTAYAMNHGLQPTTEQLVDITKQMGKALQDPQNGLGALHRVGVNVDELTEKFKTITNTEERQKLIVQELNKEFGGSGASQAETYAGKIERLKNVLNDLEEKVGMVIVNALTPLVKALSDFANSEQVQTFITDLTERFTAFVASLKPVGDWIIANRELVITFIEGLGVALGALLVIGTITALVMALTNPLVLVAIAITALFTAWQTNFLGIRDITQQVVDFLTFVFTNVVMPLIGQVSQWVQDHWFAISSITQGLWNIIVGIIKIATGLIGTIVWTALLLLTGNFDTAGEKVRGSVQMLWDGLKQLFSGIIQTIIGYGALALQNLVAPFEDAWHRIEDIMKKIRDALDFTKRHSPSVIDIVQHGVDLVNRAYEDLAMPLQGVSAQAIGASLAPGSGGTTNIAIDLSGAMISDEAGAMKMGEMIGDSLLKKLQMSVRT